MKRCSEKAKQEILTRYICGDTLKGLSEEFGIYVAAVYDGSIYGKRRQESIF